MAGHEFWAVNGSYEHRAGNEVDILIDGQKAYKEISDCFHSAKKFIYLTISYGDQNFLLVPGNLEAFFFDILRSRQKDGVDVRMVVWQPAIKTADTIPDPAPIKIPGINEGSGSIQARWDRAKGYYGLDRSSLGQIEPCYLLFPSELSCHHQKTYIMDDGGDGYLAFVGGINPVQFYWDTQDHNVFNKGRVKFGEDPLKGLEENPPLHDIFYKIRGPAVADVLANFVERYNGASIPKGLAFDEVSPVTAEKIPEVPGGIEVQVVRTIAPKTYKTTKEHGEQGIRELYFNMLEAADAKTLIYIENQYFFDIGIVKRIHDAANRGAKVIVVLTWKPDEGMFQGEVEAILEAVSSFAEVFRLIKGHENVGLFTLGNHRSVPGDPNKLIISETYIHSKNMAVIGDEWAIMTGGSANIAFTSMWFHSEMNIAFTDITRIKNWVAQLWSEHLGISVEEASGLIEKPDEALDTFKKQAAWNTQALTNGQEPKGRVYQKSGTVFPARDLAGIDGSSGK
ncbi:MAG: phospholipase D-like domain-containing protein [Syntrophobacteraceae bacterium]